ncbi:acyl carrier protein [Labilithrix luteola]|nr:phosphopantetheine-binding protein [Labilithrix luteola]
MREDTFDIVRRELSSHIGWAPAEIGRERRLDRDLGLDPLDLVLLALRLEDREGAEFPVAELAGIRTVGDLVAVVHTWFFALDQQPAVARERSARLTDTFGAPPPPASGIRLCSRPITQDEMSRVQAREGQP